MHLTLSPVPVLVQGGQQRDVHHPNSLNSDVEMLYSTFRTLLNWRKGFALAGVGGGISLHPYTAS